MRIISNQSKRCLAAVLILFAMQVNGVFAQKGIDSTYIAVTGKSYTPNFDKVSPKFEQYIEQNALSIAQKSKDYYTVSYSLVMSKTQFAELKAKLDEWRCETISINETTKFIPQEKKNRRAEIQQLQSLINDKKENLLAIEDKDRRERLQKRIDSDIEKIREYENEILELDGKMGSVWIDITLMRELTTPNETQKVKFVNMPGFEYSVFMPENPKAGISAACYNGYMLKYLFTKGKSFVTVGAFKAVDVPSSDLQMYSDLFNFSFGQDFYSRHLGRGGRKFLNLYSGYNVGYLACTGAESTLHNFYVSPAIGIELFKNNFMLFDTKVNYILPFIKNLNMRGLQFAASLNFVF